VAYMERSTRFGVTVPRSGWERRCNAGAAFCAGRSWGPCSASGP
jgi:hypothetical protein